jgi:hypothetical protein
MSYSDVYDSYGGGASYDASYGANYGASSYDYSAPSSSSGSVYVAGSNSRVNPNISLDQYKLQVDPNPTVIRKKAEGRVTLTQNVSLKYLKPPSPPQPGDITITQEPDVQAPAAPPLVVRQPAPPAPLAPAPLIVRERPPVPPNPIGPKNIVIPGRVLPPPPRQVIVEKPAPQPARPQDIIIERWLGYPRRTRNVVFRPAPPAQLAAAPAKNVLVEWDAPDVDLRQEFRFLGVQQADPRSYLSQYGNSLVDASRLPREAAHFTVPAGETLAIDSHGNDVPVLRGDLQALRLVDLNCNGLSEYGSQLGRY